MSLYWRTSFRHTAHGFQQELVDGSPESLNHQQNRLAGAEVGASGDDQGWFFIEHRSSDQKMDKAKIEQLVTERVLSAVDAAVAECVRELNASGHAFARSSEELIWIDENADQVLEVTCALGVGIGPVADTVPAPDPATEAFMELALEGKDRVATVLFRFEGELANGGFGQLFENKDPGFVREAIGYLQDIGASAAAKLALQALELYEQRQNAVREYEQLQSELERHDRRFARLSIDIPALYARFASKP